MRFRATGEKRLPTHPRRQESAASQARASFESISDEKMRICMIPEGSSENPLGEHSTFPQVATTLRCAASSPGREIPASDHADPHFLVISEPNFGPGLGDGGLSGRRDWGSRGWRAGTRDRGEAEAQGAPARAGESQRQRGLGQPSGLFLVSRPGEIQQQRGANSAPRLPRPRPCPRGRPPGPRAHRTPRKKNARPRLRGTGRLLRPCGLPGPYRLSPLM